MSAGGDTAVRERARLAAIPWRMYLLIGFVGLGTVAIVAYGFGKGMRMTTVYTPLVHATVEIRLAATTAHLWLEEIISGDRHESIEEVWGLLDRADRYAGAMLEGGDSSEGFVLPRRDADLRERVEAVRTQLHAFRAATEQRLASREDVGAGTPIDQRYDAVFESLMDETIVVETQLHQLVARDLDHFELVQFALIGVCLLLSATVGLTFHRFERRRATALATSLDAYASLAAAMDDRKRATAALRESETRFRQLVENIHEVFWMENAEGTELLYVSPAYEQVWGRSCREFYENPRVWIEAIHAEDRQRVVDAFGRFRETGNYSEEFRIVRPDGSIRWIWDRGVLIHDESGRIHRVAGIAEDVTERKRAENRQQLTQFAVDRGADPIYWVRADGGISYANAAAAKILGYTRDELTSMSVTQFDPDFPAEAWPAHWREMKEAGSMSFEAHHRTKAGRVFPVEIYTNFVIFDGHEYIWAYVRDITERKQTEEALRESERLLLESQSVAQIGSYVLDIPSGVWRSSPVLDRIFGIGKDYEHSVEGWLDLLHPDERQSLADYMAHDVLEEHGRFDREYRVVRHDDGIERWVLGLGKLEFDARGRPVSMVGTIQDITERKRAEAALRRSSRALRVLSECNEALVRSANEKELLETMCKTIVNSGGYRMAWIGFAEQDQDKTVRPVAHCGRCDEFVDSVNITWADDDRGRGPTGTAIRTGEASIAHDIMNEPRFAAWREAARERGYQSSISLPLRDEDACFGALNICASEPDAFDDDEIKLLSDLAEDLAYGIGALRTRRARREAQAETHRLNVELELRVAQRTAQLEAANKELESFAYSVSHDLRAPLRGIDGFSKALLEDYGEKLDRTGKDFLNRVRLATQRMSDLIDDLLDLSRVARSDFRDQEVDLSAVAESIGEELRASDPERLVEFIIQPGAAVKGDARLLRLVLSNLLSNAWKFTRKCKQAQIEFGSENRDGAVTYFVRDNGAGFDMVYVDKLFGAFQRLHNTAEFPGTGIGLAIVQRVIHRHGGRVWAEGAVDRGATFHFTVGSHSGHG